MGLPTKIRLDQNRSATRSVVVNKQSVDKDISFRCTSISEEDAEGIRIVSLEVTNGDSVHAVRKESDRVDVLLRQFEKAGVLDEYTYFPEPEIEVIESESFDSGSIDSPFSSTGGSAWTVDSTVFSSGPAAVQSGDIGNRRSSILRMNYTTVQDNLKIKFKWKVSSQESSDYLTFKINGTTQSQISGEADWSEVSFDLATSGSYTFKWIYSKDGSGSSGSDSGWIDDVVIYSE